MVHWLTATKSVAMRNMPDPQGAQPEKVLDEEEASGRVSFFRA
jgi:hypothetical protein